MAYPSVLSTYTDPVPTDRLSTTPHSSIETAQNTGLREIQAFVGTLSSLQGTLVYDIRGANSNGGGHVQTANLGGTGQTTYTKGDILVASSASVLTKLSAGADNTVLSADSGAATGLSYKGVATAIDIQNETYTYARASVMSASVYGVVLNQAVSILSDGLGLVVKFPTANTTTTNALTVNATGPSSVTALIKRTNLSNLAIGDITASMIGVVKFDSVSSVFQLLNTSSGKNSGVSTRAGNAASSVQAIAHGLGRTPSRVKITAYKAFYSGAVSAFASTGTYDQTSVSTTYFYGDGVTNSGAAGTDSTNLVNISDSGSKSQTAVPTLDATNINLSWTKTSTPSGDTIAMLWEVE